MDTDHLGAGGVYQSHELLHLETRHAELGVHARGLHVFMVAPALSRIDSNEKLRARKQFAPGLQWVEIVERDLQSVRERPFVFGTRREVRRKQHA